MIRILLLATVLTGAFGCNESVTTDFVWDIQPAVISHYGDSSIVVPATGSVGVPFVVQVTSYGGGCVREGTTRSSVQGMIATVEPLDWKVVQLPPNGACTLELRSFLHAATIEFASTGDAVVRVIGRRDGSSQVFTYERIVQMH